MVGFEDLEGLLERRHGGGVGIGVWLGGGGWGGLLAVGRLAVVTSFTQARTAQV